MSAPVDPKVALLASNLQFLARYLAARDVEQIPTLPKFKSTKAAYGAPLLSPSPAPPNGEAE